MRADKRENVDKVAAIKAKNPNARELDIAKETGLGKSTVNRAMQEVGNIGIKDERIVSLTNEDFSLMNKIQAEKHRRMKTPEEVNNKDINSWEQTATNRFTLFRGNATDEKGGLNVEAIDFYANKGE